jgi:hypothetical protein
MKSTGEVMNRLSAGCAWGFRHPARQVKRHRSQAVRRARMADVSWLSVALLACAVLAVIGAEWPKLSERLGLEARRKRQRARRKSQWSDRFKR